MIELTNSKNIREEVVSVLEKEDVWTDIKNDFWEDNKFNTSYSYRKKIHFGYDKEQQRFVYRKIISGTGSFSVPIEEHFIDSKLLFKSSIVINKGTKLSKIIFDNKEEESKEYFIKLLKREIRKEIMEINKKEILGFSQEDILVLVSQGILEKNYLNQLGDDKLQILQPSYSLVNFNKFHNDNHISIFNEVFEEYALEFRLPTFVTEKESVYFYETIINKYSLFIKENWFDYEYYRKSKIKDSILKNLKDLYCSENIFNKKIEYGLIDLFDSCVIDAEKSKNPYDERILELLIKFPVVSKHFKENYIFISNYDNYEKPLVSKFSSKVTKIYLENTNSFLKFDVYNFQKYSELIENDIEIFIPKGSKSLLKQLKSLSEATQKINTFSEKENESFIRFQKYLDFFIKNTKETDNIFNTNFYLKKNN